MIGSFTRYSISTLDKIAATNVLLCYSNIPYESVLINLKKLRCFPQNNPEIIFLQQAWKMLSKNANTGVSPSAFDISALNVCHRLLRSNPVPWQALSISTDGPFEYIAKPESLTADPEECTWSSRSDLSAEDILGLLLPRARDKTLNWPFGWPRLLSRNEIWQEQSFHGVVRAGFISMLHYANAKEFCRETGPSLCTYSGCISSMLFITLNPCRCQKAKGELKETEAILTFRLMTAPKADGGGEGQTSDGNGGEEANEGESGSNETCKNQLEKKSKREIAAQGIKGEKRGMREEKHPPRIQMSHGRGQTTHPLGAFWFKTWE